MWGKGSRRKARVALIGPLSSSSTPSWRPELWMILQTRCAKWYTVWYTLWYTVWYTVSICIVSKFVKVCQNAAWANCSALHSALGPASHVPLSGSWPAQLNTMLLSEWRNGGSISGATCSMFKTQRRSEMLCLSLLCRTLRDDVINCNYVAFLIRSIDPTAQFADIMWHCFDMFRPFPELIWAYLSSQASFL